MGVILPQTFLGLIDVRSEYEDPFLLETNQRHGNWVALSYCWGSSPSARTTRRNFQQHCNKISMSALPQTIKDAIIITRRVGYRYIWIDSLCIIQDSPEDWAVESLKMADVYGGASLTIAAEAAIDTASGIFDSANVFRQQQSQNLNFSIKGYHPLYPRDNGSLYLRDFVNLQPSKLKSCLKNRAWALQEDLMSRRLLSFGKEQMYWRCVTQESIEACPSQPLNFIKLQLSEGYYADFVSRNMKSGNTTLPSWYGIVNDYTTRRISVQSDLLVGISAIAKVMAEETGQPPAAYKAVTDDAPNRTVSRIIEIVIEHENDDQFGKVSGGHVKLSGPTLEICCLNIPHLKWDSSEDAAEFRAASIGGDTRRTVFPWSYDTTVSERDLAAHVCRESHPMLLLINISTISTIPTIPTISVNIKKTLILQSTGSLDVYQRVGYLDVHAYNGDFKNPDWTAREITII
ncbi:hypothetical protein BOTNAR_0023g00050 [Botryotinia narcissicola]|uniref:Heterokaryon incompatibility domain-containing protein n=1 Tax=Botryotinia narcissicola TaxID=278944 RepID=A0A4Z1JHR0_9HELO|nr:hypothetical protein BOTNAR_0023g00050 [Botryotinia narcissicola]